VRQLLRWPCTRALACLTVLAVLTPYALAPLAVLVIAVTGWALWHQ
jgi:hypothetical protein